MVRGWGAQQVSPPPPLPQPFQMHIQLSVSTVYARGEITVSNVYIIRIERRE
jgi:hypothetical protein